MGGGRARGPRNECACVCGGGAAAAPPTFSHFHPPFQPLPTPPTSSTPTARVAMAVPYPCRRSLKTCSKICHGSLYGFYGALVGPGAALDLALDLATAVASPPPPPPPPPPLPCPALLLLLLLQLADAGCCTPSVQCRTWCRCGFSSALSVHLPPALRGNTHSPLGDLLFANTTQHGVLARPLPRDRDTQTYPPPSPTPPPRSITH